MKNNPPIFLILILGIIFTIFGFGTYVYDLEKAINLPTHNITTLCYDKYNNIINNITCLEEVYDDNQYNGINGMAKGISILMILIVGLIGITITIVSVKFILNN